MWRLSLPTLVALLCGGGRVLASPIADLGYRAIEATAVPEPWVSIIASGVRSTITPVLTTIDGKPTTLNAFPSPTTTTSFGVIPDGTATTSPTSTATGIGAFEICHNANGEFAPLCAMPNNNTLYISETYYVTWDSSYYTTPNATVRVMLNYNNATGGGPQAWESGELLNSWGYVSLKIDKAWLQGSSSNNLTLYINSMESSHQTTSKQGPTIRITSRPPQHYTPPDPTKAPDGASLYIALPTVAVFVIIALCGTCIMNRKHRHIGLGNIMSRNRGYRPSSKRNRRKRMQDIQLRDFKNGHGARTYRDEEDPFTDRPGTGKGLGLGIRMQRPGVNGRSASEGSENLFVIGTPGEERDEWGVGDTDTDTDTPTRTKTVGDMGYVKESAKIIERHASGPIRPPVQL